MGIALSAMGFTALLVQTLAGDVIDKTHFDRRGFLALASVATACSASAILFVHEGNTDHALMYVTKIVEGISSSFIAPCVAALVRSCITIMYDYSPSSCYFILIRTNSCIQTKYYRLLQRLVPRSSTKLWHPIFFGVILEV